MIPNMFSCSKPHPCVVLSDVAFWFESPAPFWTSGDPLVLVMSTIEGNERMEKIYAYFERVQDLMERLCPVSYQQVLPLPSASQWEPQQLMSKVVAEKNLADYIFDKYGGDMETLRQVLG